MRSRHPEKLKAGMSWHCQDRLFDWQDLATQENKPEGSYRVLCRARVEAAIWQRFASCRGANGQQLVVCSAGVCLESFLGQLAQHESALRCFMYKEYGCLQVYAPCLKTQDCTCMILLWTTSQASFTRAFTSCASMEGKSEPCFHSSRPAWIRATGAFAESSTG